MRPARFPFDQGVNTNHRVRVCVLYSAILPVAQPRYDCIVSADDLEGAHGCHGQREPHCGGPQVRCQSSKSHFCLNRITPFLFFYFLLGLFLVEAWSLHSIAVIFYF